MQTTQALQTSSCVASAFQPRLQRPSRAFTGSMQHRRPSRRQSSVRGMRTVVALLEITSDNFEKEVAQVRTHPGHGAYIPKGLAPSRYLGGPTSRRRAACTLVQVRRCLGSDSRTSGLQHVASAYMPPSRPWRQPVSQRGRDGVPGQVRGHPQLLFFILLAVEAPGADGLLGGKPPAEPSKQPCGKCVAAAHSCCCSSAVMTLITRFKRLSQLPSCASFAGH